MYSWLIPETNVHICFLFSFLFCCFFALQADLMLSVKGMLIKVVRWSVKVVAERSPRLRGDKMESLIGHSATGGRANRMEDYGKAMNDTGIDDLSLSLATSTTASTPASPPSSCLHGR